MSAQNANRRKFLGIGALALGGFSLGCKREAEKTSSSEKVQLKWKMVTTWPKNFPGLGTGANRLAEYIEVLTNGQIKVKIFGAGELVPALGVFDAVTRGTAEIGHGASYYWQGKHPATPFFSAVPFGLNAHEMNGWLYYGGGLELWHKLYDQFGLVAFPAGNTGVQMGGWFNKEINSPKDFKGLKVRMPGLGGQVLSKLGAAVVTLSGGEIFQSLKTGAIDGSEWVGPYNDLAIGLHKAAKYYYTPGWHEPGTTLEALINKKAFITLPKQLQKAVKIACQAANQDMMAEFTAKNSEALVTIKSQKNVNLREFNQKTLEVLKRESDELLKEISSKDNLSKAIYNSFHEFQKRSLPWNLNSELAYGKALSSLS